MDNDGKMPDQAEDKVKKTGPTVTIVNRVGANSATYIIHGEGHTIGNAARNQMMKDPEVDLCGYTVPHPMEDAIRVRVQTNPASSKSSTEAFCEGLQKIVEGTDHIVSCFDAALEEFEIRNGRA